MCEIPNKDTENLKLLPCLPVAKRGCAPKGGLAESLPCFLYKPRPICQCPISSAFACCRRPWLWAACPQSLVLVVVSLPAFRFRCLCACTQPNLFCLVFGVKFNIFSALFVHQSFTLPQKNDSREGLFWCKKGWHVDVGKMNFYLKKPPFAPYFGPFLAEYGAICCKMACNMRQNAVRFGAKWRAFWC